MGVGLAYAAPRRVMFRLAVSLGWAAQGGLANKLLTRGSDSVDFDGIANRVLSTKPGQPCEWNYPGTSFESGQAT